MEVSAWLGSELPWLIRGHSSACSWTWKMVHDEADSRGDLLLQRDEFSRVAAVDDTDLL